MEFIMVIFPYVFWMVIFGFIARHIAKKKGYKNGFLWGFFLGIIGIIVVACRTDKRLLDAVQAQSAAAGWKCVSCGTSNIAEGRFCSMCGTPKPE